ncbi:hypothetical protein [Marixanthomonas spongiae]|uniref:DUF5689 domain-containing protein n=1 Tax=Marixanthomonas spongiae TaxID=2174845 RepID=A0A2U0HU04_9FLAO|nr:hypothetical protein [Marixanthomonas spongiae]PVW12325.1 hypothetical protein DDV96_15075 [Marixanthomonas spongiae]
MKKLLYACIAAAFLVSCTVDNTELTEHEQDLTQELATDNSNLGLYKGVFTTQNSKYRAQVEIVFPNKNSLAVSAKQTIYPTAKMTTQYGDVYEAKASKIINDGEAISNLLFTSKDFEFTFSADKNGNNVIIENVIFKSLASSILALKSTSNAPIVNLTGTYDCIDCGNPEPMTFNVMISNDGTGNQTYSTQMNFNGQTYFGDGLQNGCEVDTTNNNLTFCNAESGDGASSVGFTVGSNNYPVEWTGQMTYSNNTPNCSELVGLWYFRRGTSAEKSGTFRTDQSFRCLENIVFENFEDADVNYTSSIPEFTDGSEDYFIRTDGSDFSGSINFTDIIGNSYFAAQDIDGEGEDANQHIIFENMDVSLYSTIYFDALFAEDDDGSNQDWDDDDYVSVDYSFDNGTTWNSFFAIRNDGTEFNTVPLVDTNLDGTGDGEEITDTFKPFRAAFENNSGNNPTSSPTVSIRISMSLDSGDEDIAIDNVLIRGI